MFYVLFIVCVLLPQGNEQEKKEKKTFFNMIFFYLYSS